MTPAAIRKRKPFKALSLKIEAFCFKKYPICPKEYPICLKTEALCLDFKAFYLKTKASCSKTKAFCLDAGQMASKPLLFLTFQHEHLPFPASYCAKMNRSVIPARVVVIG